MKQKSILLTIGWVIFLILSPNLIRSEITTIIVSFNAIYRPDAKKIEKYIRSKLNLRNYLSLLVKGIPKSEEITEQFFTLLSQIGTVNTLNHPNNWHTNYPSYETKGHKFPPIFCQMFTNSTLSDEQKILKKILHYLHKHSNIRSKTRKKILQAVVETIFQTNIMNQFIAPLPSAINLMRSLKQMGYQIILIGNIPGYAWDVWLQSHSQSAAIKELFDEGHRFISGKLNMLKTSDTMYELIIAAHNLDPENCLVIESNYNNLQYPQQRGMYTLTFDANKAKIDHLEQQLNQIL